jgi:hypothetical protein
MNDLFQLSVVFQERIMNPLTADFIKQSGIVIPTLSELEEMQRAGKISLESRALTPGERAQARADQQARAAKFDVGDESEARGSGWLSRFFNAEVRKNALRQVQTPTGPHWVSQDVDFDLLRPLGLGDCRSITKVEIKGTLGNSFPLARLSDRERGFLNRALAHGYSAWILCLWWHKTDTGQDCELMHLVPWAEWKQIEAALKANAAGNFKGKSIRRKVDLKGWDRYAITKVNSRWQLDPAHWLRASPNPIDHITQGDA